MSHFNDYMDGVPVKISEKYKRPPRIELPYTVSESITRAQHVVETTEYCTKFENNVLAKIKELRSAKETKKNERKHRLQLLEEAKQKKLDEIAAAEAEEKLKLLSVSEVSYPSTEELSALSADEQAENNCDMTTTQTNSPETAEASTTADFTYPSCSNVEPIPNILQPIQVKANYQQNNLLDDPDPLQDLKINSAIKKVPQYTNMETLTYKDFENDTSSPFDNVELKTINDMEQLAQVLQSQRDSSTSCINPPMYVSDPYPIPNCASQAPISGVAYLPNTYIEQPIQPNVTYSPQHYPTNGYYIPENCENPIPVDNTMYVPNYQYYVPENQYIDPNYYSNQMPTVPEVSPVPNGYIPEPYYFHYPHIPMQYPTYNPQVQNMQMNTDVPVNNLNTNLPVNNLTDSKSTVNSQSVKSRSRSVPDIIKELNDEIVMAKRRANERSCNASPAPKLVPRTSSHSEKRPDKSFAHTSTLSEKESKKHRRREHLPNPFDKLPVKAQGMCQKISTMGFPLDRVARICTLVGDNDKKIIEGLLLLGELLDLGFPEGRVSAALAKHEFNKDKALDELVS